MKDTLLYSTDAIILVSFLFVLMVAFTYFGRQFGKSRMTDESKDNPGNRVAITSLYALFGLILAFTFGMSGARYEARKQVIIEESNCISTAYLRISLYPDSLQPLFRDDFRNYLEARIAYFDAGKNMEELKKSLRYADSISTRIWSRATYIEKNSSNPVQYLLMIPALNEMIDITNTRLYSEINRIPDSILLMLLLLSVSSAFVSGYISAVSKKFDWFIAVAFCILTSVVIYFILDLDRPRRGIINLNMSNQSIIELRKVIK
jgi:hypothetical protein